MGRRRLVLTTTVGLVVAGVCTAGIVAASSSTSGGGGDRSAALAAAFSPKSLAGKWTGTWTNRTFGSTGAIRANVRFRNGRFVPRVDFGGNVLGCPDPPAETVTLTKGSGADKWNARGFKVDEQTQAFGELKITYKHRGKSFTGSGGKPPCRPDEVTFTLKGKLTSTRFTATVTIQLPGQTAVADLTATKS